MTADIAMRENSGSRLEEDLLPGIVDQIVLEEIVPKLQWKDLYILSSVSRAWYNANRSHRVFNSRVLSRSLETFVPFYYSGHTIAIYSMRENLWHELPLITDASRRRHQIPALGQCVSMNGKIYVLGGVMDSEVSNRVFVFDLAGQGHWEECASMKQRRLDFGTAVLDGKIYVFGGKTGTAFRESLLGSRYDLLMSGSEVYEPNEDTWSPIRRMTTCRFGHHVTVIGEEVFIYGGFTIGSSPTAVNSLEAYHPVKDEWRVVQSSWNQPKYWGVNFTVQGNLFSIERVTTPGNVRFEWLAIHKYDLHRNSSIKVHAFSFGALVPVQHASVRYTEIPVILSLHDELIALVSCRASTPEGTRGMCIFQSAGFGSENQKISWKLIATTFGEPAFEISNTDNANFFGQML